MPISKSQGLTTAESILQRCKALDILVAFVRQDPDGHWFAELILPGGLGSLPALGHGAGESMVEALSQSLGRIERQIDTREMDDLL